LHEKDSKPLIEIVKLLEGKTNNERCLQTLKILSFSSFKPFLEPYKLRFSKGNNIILKVKDAKEEILITGHYDTVKGSPGANDNASCIAAIYGLLKKIDDDEHFDKAIRIIIFADEENGLKGSRGYIKKNGIKNIKAVINIELVGAGDSFLLWPVNLSNKDSKVIQAIESGGVELSVNIKRGEGFSRFIGDHQAFLNAGVSETVCLSMILDKDAETVNWYANQSYLKSEADNIDKKIPEIFEIYHSPYDTSGKLSETSLQLTAELLYRTIKKI